MSYVNRVLQIQCKGPWNLTMLVLLGYLQHNTHVDHHSIRHNFVSLLWVHITCHHTSNHHIPLLLILHGRLVTVLSTTSISLHWVPFTHAAQCDSLLLQEMRLAKFCQMIETSWLFFKTLSAIVIICWWMCDMSDDCLSNDNHT